MDVTIALTLTGIVTLFICLLFALMFTYYFMLKRISVSFPEYYHMLGSPFLPTASRRAIAKTIRRDDFNYMLLGNIIAGTPAGFPSDAHLRRLAFAVRIELLATLVCIGAGIGLAIIQ